jgi:hypothetical protein
VREGTSAHALRDRQQHGHEAEAEADADHDHVHRPAAQQRDHSVQVAERQEDRDQHHRGDEHPVGAVGEDGHRRDLAQADVGPRGGRHR